MPRSPEIETLIRTGALEAVKPTPFAIKAFLSEAAGYLAAARALDPKLTHQVFTMGYEGYFQVVQAVLEHFEVRTKDAGRNLVIQRVAHELGANPDEFAFLTNAHSRRNGTSYVSPFPPVSRTEAITMVSLLAKFLPLAHALTGIPIPTPT